MEFKIYFQLMMDTLETHIYSYNTGLIELLIKKWNLHINKN